MSKISWVSWSCLGASMSFFAIATLQLVNFEVNLCKSGVVLFGIAMITRFRHFDFIVEQLRDQYYKWWPTSRPISKL